MCFKASHFAQPSHKRVSKLSLYLNKVVIFTLFNSNMESNLKSHGSALYNQLPHASTLAIEAWETNFSQVSHSGPPHTPHGATMPAEEVQAVTAPSGYSAKTHFFPLTAGFFAAGPATRAQSARGLAVWGCLGKQVVSGGDHPSSQRSREGRAGGTSLDPAFRPDTANSSAARQKKKNR